jgi:hypothetical protein
VTVATQIAQNVIERLKLESLGWRTLTTKPVDDLQSCALLKSVLTKPGVFTTLPPRQLVSGDDTRILSNAFDYTGVDVVLSGATAAQVRFCASYRLTFVYDDFRSLRADVRVWWSKEAPTRDILSPDDFVGCQDDGAALNPGGVHYDDYHVVYLSTVLRPGAG